MFLLSEVQFYSIVSQTNKCWQFSFPCLSRLLGVTVNGKKKTFSSLVAVSLWTRWLVGNLVWRAAKANLPRTPPGFNNFQTHQELSQSVHYQSERSDCILILICESQWLPAGLLVSLRLLGRQADTSNGKEKKITAMGHRLLLWMPWWRPATHEVQLSTTVMCSVLSKGDIFLVISTPKINVHYLTNSDTF